jgi:short-chain fatty acids transporter
MERLTYSFWFSKGIALLFFTAVVVQYATALEQGSLSPNFLNFSMLGCCFLLHKNIHHFLLAVKEAVKGVGGILIQFPLYFGIMGLLSSSGLGQQIALVLVGFATPSTLPIITFFSAGILNLFVPSGGGQWAIQGPIIIESAQQLGVSLPKTIMAFAYGDQITNMLQPFWALPLLAITKLKAKELLPYSLIIMAVGGMVFLVGLML